MRTPRPSAPVVAARSTMFDGGSASLGAPPTRHRAFAAAALGIGALLAAGYGYAHMVAGRPWAPSTDVRAAEKPTVVPVLQHESTAPRTAESAARPMPEPPAASADAAPTEATDTAGWIEIESPIVLQVREGDRVFGTAAHRRLRLAAGVHRLDLVNGDAGVHLKRTVQIVPGKVTPLEVAVEKGTLALNATPWADVWLDGRPVGQTPLGRVTATAGLHEVVFRHPSFGEQRRTIAVPVSGTARLSVDLRTK